jgi:ribonuclease T2
MSRFPENPMRLRLIVAFAAGLAIAITGAAKSSHHSHSGSTDNGARGVYDYYVMALSWSPTFCELHLEEDEQCSHKGYGFVLHGLWPQYEGGGGPEKCATTDEPDRKTVASALAFMPSRELVSHEWRTHGACTGLGPAGYFSLADRAFAAVHVPPEFNAPRDALHMTSQHLIDAFKAANAGLADDALTLHCSRGELVEVRVCLDKQLAPRSCGKRMQSRCPATAEFTLPASR